MSLYIRGHQALIRPSEQQVALQAERRGIPASPSNTSLFPLSLEVFCHWETGSSTLMRCPGCRLDVCKCSQISVGILDGAFGMATTNIKRSSLPSIASWFLNCRRSAAKGRIPESGYPTFTTSPSLPRHWAAPLPSHPGGSSYRRIRARSSVVTNQSVVFLKRFETSCPILLAKAASSFWTGALAEPASIRGEVARSPTSCCRPIIVTSNDRFERQSQLGLCRSN